MKKGNLIEKQQICLDANSAASRSKFLHFKSVLTILALCLCIGGKVFAADGDNHSLFDVTTASNWEYSINSFTNNQPWTSNKCIFSSAHNNNRSWTYVGIGGKKLNNAIGYIGTIVATTYQTAELKYTISKARTNNNLKINSVTLKVYSGYNSSTKTYSTLIDEVSYSADTYKNLSDNSVITFTPSGSYGSTCWANGVYFKLEFNLSNSSNSNYITQISKIVAVEGCSSGGGSTPCTPTWDSDDYGYISNFTVTQGGSTLLNSSSTGTANSNTDYYSSRSITAAAGSTINLSITPSGSSDTYGFAVWIDFDADGMETSDMVLNTSTYVDPPYSGSYTIPANTPAGEYRLRILQDYYIGAPSNPCGSYNYGESEDYKLIVTAPVYYTVTYNGNGSTGGTPPTDAGSYLPGASATVLGNTGSLVKTGYTFGGWNTQADGNGTTYAPGDNLTVSGNTILYALWLRPYTVTWSIDGTTTTQNYPIGGSYALTVPSGVATDATSYNCYDRVFVGWTANSSWSSDNPPADLFRTPSGNVSANTTYYAVFAYESGLPATWELVNNVSELAVGDKVVIAASGYDYAISTTQSGNNRAQAEITKSGSTITWSSSVCEFDLKAGTVSGTWAFYDATNTGYIYAASSSSNYLRTQATNDPNGSWAISISNGTATITAQGTNTRNQLKYNNGDNIFSCYGSGQKAVAIYKKVSSYYGYSTSCTPCTDPTFSLPSASGIVNMGSTLSISLTNPNNTEVTWTSSNPSIATVSGTNTGATITGVNYGSATITASIRAANVSGTYYCPATVTYNVTVACATITLPVCFDFEDYASPNSAIGTDAGLPTCWNRIYSGSSSGYAPHVYNGTYAMDGNGIVFTSGSSSSYGSTNYVVLPYITGLRAEDIVTFNAWWEYSSYGTLTLGYMTDPSNASTFISIGEATPTDYSGGSAATGQNEMTIPAGIPSGAYLAFKWYHNSTYYSVAIDNICIEHSCTPIPGTFALNTTSGSVVAPGTIDISSEVNNGIDQNLYPGTLSYRSSNSNVATVSAVGVITGVAEGEATITVTFTPDDPDLCRRTATYTLTVTDECSKIGTGSSTTYNVPLNTYYEYTYTQMLYKQSELGAAGIITSIGFQYAYSTPISGTSVKIYMVETTKTEFSGPTDWVTSVTESNRVYSGNLNCSYGWNSFTLDDPFVYSGTKNLLVVIDDNSASYLTTSHTFNYTATDWNSVLSYYSTSNNKDNSNIDGVSANFSYYTYRPNTKFCKYSGTLYTITYNTSANCDGGVANSIAQTYGVSGYSTMVTSEEPTCSTGIFEEWNTEEDGSGYSYGPGEPITLSGDITLYAQYTICNYIDIVKTTAEQGLNDGALVNDEGVVVNANGVQKFNVCKDSNIRLEARTNDNMPGNVSITSYSWDVNRHDGNAHLTSSTNSISYTVENAMGHDILLTVNASNGCREQIPVRIFVSKGLTIHGDDPIVGPVCVGRAKEIVVGDPAVVNEPVIEVDNDAVEIKSSKGVAEVTFIPDGEGQHYVSPVTFSDFKESTVINEASNIDYVRINMEHSHIGDMQISLKCRTPENVEKSVVILPFSGSSSYSWPYKVIECRAEYERYANSGAAGNCDYDPSSSSTTESRRTYVVWDGTNYSATGVRQEATAFSPNLTTDQMLVHLKGMINAVTNANDPDAPHEFCDAENNGYGTGNYHYKFNRWYNNANHYSSSNYNDGDAATDEDNWGIESASLGFGKPNLIDGKGANLTELDYNPYGEGFDYCWSNNDDYDYADGGGYVYETVNHRRGDTNAMTVIESDFEEKTQFYRPSEGFGNLIGCKLNGTWTIDVYDNQEKDNGYIFNWEIGLKGVEDNSWVYTVSLDHTGLGTCPYSGSSIEDLISESGGTNFYIHPTIANIEGNNITIPDYATIPVNYYEGSCQLTLVDDIGCQTEGNGFKYRITQPAVPHFTEKPVNICLGETAVVEASLTGTITDEDHASFTWWEKPYGDADWTADPPETGITSVFSATPDHSGDQYRVEIYDGAGCGGIIDDIIYVNTPNPETVSDYDYVWRGATAENVSGNYITDWNTPVNWYTNDNGTFSVADEVPNNASNVYVGDAGCQNRGENTGYPTTQGDDADVHNLYIGTGASVTVPANKTLNIAGNLYNIGGENVITGAGTVVFFGNTNDVNQEISNDIAFGNVTFNNRGGDIDPAGSVTINGAATFTSGVVLGDVTFTNGASVVNPNSLSYNSFVDGKVTKTTVSSSSFTFPTGSGNVLGTVSATLPASSSTDVTFSHTSGSGTFEMPEADMCAGNNPRLDHVSSHEYWKVNTSSDLNDATLKVSAADPDAHFTLPGATTFEGSHIYGAIYKNGCWENIGDSDNPAVVSNDHTTITVSGVDIPRVSSRASDAQCLTLGSSVRSTLLPIELTALTATCDGRKALVEWTTASERNNDYFSLERSDDAINFTEIARIAGAGNSIAPLEYSYTDYGVHGGDNYYRLVQVDYDGTRTASEIVVANCIEASGEPEVLAYPNPFSGDLTVELENFGDRPARIDVYDMLGRLVYTEEVGAPQNSYQTVLHFGNLPDATYTVRVGTADFVINRKVVKQQ